MSRSCPGAWDPELLPRVPQPPPPGFAGPLLLLAAGLGLGLVASPGPWPDLPALASCAAALLVYGAAAVLARRGRAGLVVALVVAVALGLAVAAFGPDPLDNRKVTLFNAWAYDLGAHLPPLNAPPHPNAAAGVLALGLGLAGAAALRGVRRRWAVPAVLVMITALVLTASRAGWLAGAAAGLVLAGAQSPRALRPMLGLASISVLGVVLVTLGLVALAATGPQAGRSVLLSTYSLAVRIQQWDQTRALLQARPLVGLGLARFPAAYAAAVAGAGHRAYDTPANGLLEVWADAGVLGLTAVAWIACRAVRLLRLPAPRPRAGWVSLGLAAALAALAVDGLFESVTAIVWRSGTAYGYLASPLPFLLLGLLAGISQPAGRAASLDVGASDGGYALPRVRELAGRGQRDHHPGDSGVSALGTPSRPGYRIRAE